MRRTLSEPYHEQVFDGGDFVVGRFDCPPDSPLWRQENQIELGPLFVVPQTGVEIEQVGHQPVITSVASVMLYNRDQIYRRRLVDARGDRCSFFRVPPALIAEMLAAHGLPGPDDPERPFLWPSGPLDPKVFLAHRRAVQLAFSEGAERDALFEEVIRLLDLILHELTRHYGSLSRVRIGERAREAVHETQRYLIDGFCEGDTLQSLGERVDLSGYHLARSFRTVTGLSVHDYRERLRVLYALENLDLFDRLVDLAFEAGYSSHSHFTQSFRRMLGTTPARVRRASQGRS